MTVGGGGAMGVQAPDRETDVVSVNSASVVRLARRARHHTALTEPRRGFSSDERGGTLDSGRDVSTE